MGQTIILIGATGLVGSEILKLALEDKRIERVSVFTRRSTGVSHSKLTEHIVDFESLDDWKKKIFGDILISALGTTKAQSGSREAQRNVDYDYQLRIAQCAKINGVRNYVLISAPGAHHKSPFSYTKIKGDLERDVKKISFDKVTIIRPGLLKGYREHPRPLEQVSVAILSKLPVLPGLESLSPVEGQTVAYACLENALDGRVDTRILNPREVLTYAKSQK